ncbi:MAG: hypothetical protein V4558_08955 [Gemmatimonadota bacterium]
MPRCLPFLIIAAAACAGIPAPQPAAKEVSLEIIATAVGDSVDGSQPFLVAPAPNRGFYLSAQALSGLVEQLDSLGRFVRVIGRIGDGPGEMREPGGLIAESGRLFITDRFGKWHTFDSTGRFLRDIPSTISGVRNAILLRGDTLVVTQRIGDPTQQGKPLHLIAPDGRIVRSFGEAPASEAPNHFASFFRELARESDTSFWVARSDRYEIELRSTSGALLRRFALQRVWFPPLDHDPESIDRERPATTILAIHRDPHGHLLVIMRRARVDWKPNPAPDRKLMAPADGMKYISETIEILDPGTGALLGSVEERDFPIMGYLGDDRLIGIREDALGRQVPVIVRLKH